MKNIYRSLIVILLSTTLLWGATQTINTLPVNDSAFISNLQAFLKNENANRFHKKYSGYIFEGGIGTTSAGLSHTISAVTGFPGGYYVYYAATSHTYTNTTRTYVLLDYDSARTITIAGATVTRTGNLVFAEMIAGAVEPQFPELSIPLMRVDTSGGSITVVSDIRPGGDISVDCYASLSDAVTRVPAKSTLVLSRTVSSANITIPLLRVESGGYLSPAIGTKTIITNLVSAPRVQWIGGAGTVAIYYGDVYPEYWGADPTGVLDSSAAITSAIAAVKSYGFVTFSPGAVYNIGSQILWNRNVHMQATGANFYYVGASSPIKLTPGGEGTTDRINKVSMWLPSITRNADNWTDETIGLELNAVSSSYFHNVEIAGFKYGIYLKPTTITDASSGVACTYNHFFIKELSNNKYSTNLKPSKNNLNKPGYPNQNTFWGGRYTIGDTHTNEYAVHANVDNTTGNITYPTYSLNGNYWINASFEGQTNIVATNSTAISFDSTTSTITMADTTGVVDGGMLEITGSTSNNDTFTVVSHTASTVVVSETLTTEASGASITATAYPHLAFKILGNQNIIYGGRMEGSQCGIVGGTKNNIDVIGVPYTGLSQIKNVGTFNHIATNSGEYWDILGGNHTYPTDRGGKSLQFNSAGDALHIWSTDSVGDEVIRTYSATGAIKRAAITATGRLGYYDSTGTLIGTRGVLYRNNTSNSSSGTGEDVLHTYTMPANTLTATSGIKVKASGTKSGSAGNKTLNFYFGTTSFNIFPAANDTADWSAEIEVENVSAGSQKVRWTFMNGASSKTTYGTASIATTSSVVVKITGECADGADSITETNFRIELL